MEPLFSYRSFNCFTDSIMPCLLFSSKHKPAVPPFCCLPFHFPSLESFQQVVMNNACTKANNVELSTNNASSSGLRSCIARYNTMGYAKWSPTITSILGHQEPRASHALVYNLYSSHAPSVLTTVGPLSPIHSSFLLS